MRPLVCPSRDSLGGLATPCFGSRLAKNLPNYCLNQRLQFAKLLYLIALPKFVLQFWLPDRTSADSRGNPPKGTRSSWFPNSSADLESQRWRNSLAEADSLKALNWLNLRSMSIVC